MLTTPTHHNRRLRAGAVLAAFGLGLPVGMAPALAETLTARAQVDVEASALTDTGTAGSDDEPGLVGAAKVDAGVSVDGYLDGLLDGSGSGPIWSGIADTALVSDVAAGAAATGALVLDAAGSSVGGGGGGDLPGLPGVSLDGDLPLVGSVGSGDGSELSSAVLGLLRSGDGDADLPGVGLPGMGGLPDVPGVGLPGLGLPGVGLPGLGLPEVGLPEVGLLGLGLPGLGLPSLPDRLPSLVLPSLITAPSDENEDPTVVNAGNVGPVGGLVGGAEGTAGEGPAAVPRNQPPGGTVQLGEGSRGSLPRTGANLRVRALAAFGLLGLAGLGSRRRRSI